MPDRLDHRAFCAPFHAPFFASSTRRAIAAFAAVAALSTAPVVAAESVVAETSAGPIEATPMAGPFENPWALAFLPDGALLVTERPGRLSLVRDGDAVLVAGMPEIGEFGQGGLLDVAVSPDFAASGVIYFSYAEPVSEGLFGGDRRTTVARARLLLDGSPRLEDLVPIFRQEPALGGRRHFGSRVVVAPDGALFIATGDRGEPDLAQDLGTHVGKLIRIAPDGTPPADNPFLDQPTVLPEIYSYGHRNIQGAAIRPEDGAIWTVEHGARGGDEINRPEAGENYGWPVISYGRHYSGASIGVGVEAPGMEQPVFYWDPSIAPSGLAFYDGDLMPEWRGDLFVGALKFQLIARLELEGDEIVGEERLFENAFGRIRDVRSGPDGALWFVTDESDGYVYRAAPPER